MRSQSLTDTILHLQTLPDPTTPKRSAFYSMYAFYPQPSPEPGLVSQVSKYDLHSLGGRQSGRVDFAGATVPYIAKHPTPISIRPFTTSQPASSLSTATGFGTVPNPRDQNTPITSCLTDKFNTRTFGPKTPQFKRHKCTIFPRIYFVSFQIQSERSRTRTRTHTERAGY